MYDFLFLHSSKDNTMEISCFWNEFINATFRTCKDKLTDTVHCFVGSGRHRILSMQFFLCGCRNNNNSNNNSNNNNNNSNNSSSNNNNNSSNNNNNNSLIHFILEQATKIQRWSRSIALLFL